MCGKERLIELLHDFVLFDGGVKKLPRVAPVLRRQGRAAHVTHYKGGIIWHTQGSGKSIVMVLLAKWILENKPNARVLILTDRDELDKQIERVFRESGEAIYRTQQRRRSDGAARPGQAAPALFAGPQVRPRGVDDFDAFIEELKQQPSPAVGELFIFVDECHRTQSGKLHKTMKALLPGAVFIGFTGTPLLKQDRQTSLEVFGGYIHTYKFGEAVEDEVVLDLVYEARDIPQQLGSQDKIDPWFEAKTKGPQRLAEGGPARAMGHDAEGAELPLAHGAGGRGHRLRLQREAAARQRARQRDAGGVEHLRGVPLLRAVREDRLQGPLRGRDVLQSAGAGRDAGGDRREHGDRKAVSLQHLHRAAEERGRRSPARPRQKPTKTR